MVKVTVNVASYTGRRNACKFVVLYQISFILKSYYNVSLYRVVQNITPLQLAVELL